MFWCYRSTISSVMKINWETISPDNPDPAEPSLQQPQHRTDNISYFLTLFSQTCFEQRNCFAPTDGWPSIPSSQYYRLFANPLVISSCKTWFLEIIEISKCDRSGSQRRILPSQQRIQYSSPPVTMYDPCCAGGRHISLSATFNGGSGFNPWTNKQTWYRVTCGGLYTSPFDIVGRVSTQKQTGEGSGAGLPHSSIARKLPRLTDCPTPAPELSWW